MHNILRVALIYSIFLFSSVSHATESNLLKIGAVVESSTERGGYFLRFTVQNIGTKDLRLYRNSLPWVERSGPLYLKAIVLNQNFTNLNSVGRLHNTAGIITLSQNQEISGAIKLGFTGLSDALPTNSVAVLWVYTPTSPDEKNLAKVSGVAIIDSTFQSTSE